MLIGNNNYDNVYVKYINRNINSDKAEVSNNVKEIGLSQVVTKSNQTSFSLNDFYQQNQIFSFNNLISTHDLINSIIKQKE